MKKLTNKGFVLAETIVVAVFMVSIFMILYKNYYPLMGKYEKKEFYDDVDSKYKAFWLKYMVEDFEYAPLTFTNNYTYFNCNNLSGNKSKLKQCNRMVSKMGLISNDYYQENEAGDLIAVAIITDNLANLQKKLPSTDLYQKASDGFIDYILSLPPYEVRDGKYLIVELYDKDKTGKDAVYKYAYIKVVKK